jgi:hypothetical protein
MAKVTGPALSLGASGSIAKTLVFSKVFGIPYARLSVIPMNPRTEAQAVARLATGSMGRALGNVLYPTAANSGIRSDFFDEAQEKKPAGQSWISYSLRKILGTALASWLANRTAFDNLGETFAARYDAGAVTLGLSVFNLDYASGAGAGAPVTGGEQLYHLAVHAVNDLGFEMTVATATVQNITDLIAFISADNA